MLEVLGVTAAMYVAVLVGVRFVGRRTLARLSGFDVLVTVAIGTILGSTAVSPSVSLTDGLVAIATLLGFQIAVGAARQRWPRFRRLVDFEPIVLVKDGETSLSRNVLGPQMTDDELDSQLRLRGVFDGAAVSKAVLEPVGELSVNTRADRSDTGATTDRNTGD